MPKTISCGIAAIRKKNDSLEILLCKPVNAGFYGIWPKILQGNSSRGERCRHDVRAAAESREQPHSDGSTDPPGTFPTPPLRPVSGWWR